VLHRNPIINALLVLLLIAFSFCAFCLGVVLLVDYLPGLAVLIAVVIKYISIAFVLSLVVIPVLMFLDEHLRRRNR
jgi:hypothetical protein